MGTALSAIHDRVNTPWTVESLAEAAGMSRSAFAARFKELLGQTPLEYVTEWRMQKAMRYYNSATKSSWTSLRRSVMSPTLRSVRRSSELSGPTLTTEPILASRRGVTRCGTN
jgi:AraC-like DNA-binding protein